MKWEDDKLSHQNIDKFFKVSAILFAQVFVDFFRLNYHVIRLYRNELLSLKLGSLFTDMVFETREDVLLNFEFLDTKLSEVHLKKYTDYKVSLQCQSGKPVVTVIICTYHIKSEVRVYEETETSLLKPRIFYLSDFYDIVKFISIKNKINNNLKLTQNDVQYLVLMPFMLHSNVRSEKLREVCNLIEEIKIKKLFDNEELYLPLVLAIEHYICDENERKKLIEVLTMDMPADEIYEKVMSSGILEKGIEQGIEQGRAENIEETVRNLFDFGMTKEMISEALKMDLNDVNEILS